MSDEEEVKPKSFTQNLKLIIAGVVVVVLGLLAYTFVGQKVEEEQVHIAETKVEAKKQEIEVKSKIEADHKAQREEAERQHALEMEKLRIQAADREAIRAKAAADQEAEKAAQAAQAAQFEERQRQQNEENDRRRREAALKKIVRLRNLAQTDLEKFKTEMGKLDTELDRLIPLATDEVAEKLRSGTVAANNQIKYNDRKIEEANLQLRESQKKPTGNDQIGILNRKIEALKNEQLRFEAAIQKIAEDTVVLNRNKQLIKDNLFLRTKLQRTIQTHIGEMKQLRGDPDFAELVKVGGDEELTRMIAEATALAEKEAPNGTRRPELPKSDPVVAKPVTGTTDTSGSVTVTAKKEKITVYTLKDGKTVSATKAVDAGDMLSVKTLDGKFQSIFKEDIVKEEAKQE